MKRVVAAVLFAALASAIPAHAEQGHGGGDDRDHHAEGGGGGAPHVDDHAQHASDNGAGPGPAHDPAPRTQPLQQRAPSARVKPARRRRVKTMVQGQAAPAPHQPLQRQPAQHQPATQAGVIPHKSQQAARPHGPVSQSLHKLGVTQQPHRFTGRSQLLATDAGHSRIDAPRQGINGQALNGHAISSKNFNSPAVRSHMGFIGHSGNGFSSGQVSAQMRSEPNRGQYYWHHGGNFDYVHYNDNWGYSWYGWYQGDSYFWTRYYGDRWWFYDEGPGRWCYWSAGAWWWQDPDDMDTVYVYEDDNYVKADLSVGP